MTEEERYLFDVQGFLVIENAIGESELNELNRILDREFAGNRNGDRAPLRGLLNLGKPFVDLIDNPRVVPILSQLLDAEFRMVEDFCKVQRQGAPAARLHNGGTPFDLFRFYEFRQGSPRCGLTVVAYNLKAVNPGDGGFACIPGSHKSNLTIPESCRATESWGRTHPSQCPLKVLSGPAGSAIIFTSGLTHGSAPWTSASERRTLFYKYAPYQLASYAPYCYDLAKLQGLNESRRRLLSGAAPAMPFESL
jgi:hypothetical protein